MDFLCSFLGQAVIYGYLALFDSSYAPRIHVTILLLMLLRVVFVFLASYAIWIGLRRELSKTVTQLGTSIKRAKSVREMVSSIQDGDMQLLIMDQLVGLT